MTNYLARLGLLRSLLCAAPALRRRRVHRAARRGGAGRRGHLQAAGTRRPTARRRVQRPARDGGAPAATRGSPSSASALDIEPGEYHLDVQQPGGGEQQLPFTVSAKAIRGAAAQGAAEPGEPVARRRSARGARDREGARGARRVLAGSAADAAPRAARAGPALELVRPAAHVQRRIAQSAFRHGHRRADGHAHQGAARRAAWSTWAATSSMATT